MKIDELDKQLLMNLQENSKITYKELSDKLNLSSILPNSIVKLDFRANDLYNKS